MIPQNLLFARRKAPKKNGASRTCTYCSYPPPPPRPRQQQLSKIKTTLASNSNLQALEPHAFETYTLILQPSNSRPSRHRGSNLRHLCIELQVSYFSQNTLGKKGIHQGTCEDRFQNINVFYSGVWKNKKLAKMPI